MRMQNRTIRVVLLAFFVSLFFGCAGKDTKTLKTIEGDPEPLYKQALALFNKRDYTEAQKKFEQVKSNFPDSPPFSTWAELKVADCHFLKAEYVEAIAAYEEFKKIHPTHEDIPYVQYQIAMGYFNQMLSPDRDQTFTKKALSGFEYLIANYPASLFADKSREKIEALKKQLADHEFYIGNYYYKQGRYQAAAVRFREVVEKYPKSPDADRTLMLLAKSYIEVGQGEKAKEALSRLVAEYARSSYSREARTMLAKGLPEKKTLPGKPPVPAAGQGDAKAPEALRDTVVLSKFEEEGRKPVSLKEETGVVPAKTGEKIQSLPAATEEARQTSPPVVEKGEKASAPAAPVEPVKEERKAEPPRVDKKAKKPNPLPPAVTDEPSKGLPPKESAMLKAGPKDEKKAAALPGGPSPTKSRPAKEDAVQPGNVLNVEKGQPIDITSDRVESFSKQNLIIFKGNVTARQKDTVIYADDLEALVAEGGKGIEKVTAGGNVKIQQGLRVASCRKAVFHNAEQKIILTGEPKVWEGENMVSGDEIVFDIEQNRVEVRGGPDGKGKAQIHPKGDLKDLQKRE
jgi:outer membrane protein assembly factor BamD